MDHQVKVSAVPARTSLEQAFLLTPPLTQMSDPEPSRTDLAVDH